jgi:hypothetical protein
MDRPPAAEQIRCRARACTQVHTLASTFFLRLVKPMTLFVAEDGICHRRPL